ncbi:hypothetical protein HDU76_008444 [Blyttiomyces sp. JEL0837]|nr:hypothetical protein HDU76_008444 [Blyttiomyces sp. JEL0837]
MRRYSGPYYITVYNSGGSTQFAIVAAVTLNLIGSYGSGLRSDSLDVTTFITVFILSMFISLSLTYLVKKIRDRVILARRIRRGEVLSMPREPPQLHSVTARLPPRLVAKLNNENNLSKDKDGVTISRSLEILKSGCIEELPQSKTEDQPLSIEYFDVHGRRFLATTRLIIMPDAEAMISEGLMPHISLATSLHRYAEQKGE